MYLVQLFKINTIDNKEFIIYTKEAVKTVKTLEFYQNGKPYLVNIIFEDGTQSDCRLNDNCQLLNEIPKTWFDQSITATLPYKGRIYRFMSHSGMSKKLIEHFSKKENRYVGIGKLLPIKGNPQFILDNGDILKTAINHYYYEPF